MNIVGAPALRLSTLKTAEFPNQFLTIFR